MLSILVTFLTNSGDLRRIILAYVLSLSFIANANVIANLSLILKASLVLRMVL
jgi:hypothetical protein